MAAWGDLLGGAGSVAEQLLLWGVLNQLIGELLGPAIELVRQEVNAPNPVAILTPEDLASAVVRNFLSADQATAEAARNGIDADRLQTLIHLAGDAPGPEELAVLLRRGDIPEDGTGAGSTSFLQGIAEGRLADKWAPHIKDLAVEWPTPTDALQAYLEGQIDEGTAQALYKQFGGNPDYFTLLFNTRGNAPTPMEALEMLNRRIITASGTGPDSTSYEQAFLEGPWRNKWLPKFQQLGVYLPPPRTITTLLKTGSVTNQQAQTWWQMAGMTPEMSAAYAKSAQGEKLAGSKALAESTVLTLYETQALTAPEATAHLAGLGYDATDAAIMLELADLQRELKYVNGAVTKLHSLYVARKINRGAAVEGLTALGITGAHQGHILKTWDLELDSEVRQLTAAEILSAWEYQILTQTEAEFELMALGYTPFDAWVKLSIKAKGAIAGRPDQGPAGPGVLP